jgi:predicted transport protein
MISPKYIKPERILLKNHPELNEKWVQQRIAEDPSILGLGDLILKDRERNQPRAGRLDLLLQDSESIRRYEVEIQLGRTDETHVIRTVEYWDIERKRYPQYDHCAVLVAEDITSRFLNVINLFNGTIPFVAIQMQAIKVEDKVALVFTTVVDELTRGLDEEDEYQELADRSYWELRGTKATVAVADQLLEMIHEFAPGLELKYNKFYIGLARDGQPNNFVIFRPKKNVLNIEIKLKQADDIEGKIEASGLDAMPYQKRFGNYRLRLSAADVKKHAGVLKELMQLASENRSS